MYDFQGSNPDDLPFQTGEIINVISQSDSGWWEGINSTGKQGFFPATYVQEIQTTETPNFANFEDQQDKPPLIPPSPASLSKSPSSQLAELNQQNQNQPTEGLTNEVAKALYPYTANKEGDLSFEEGDVLLISLRQDNGWLYGENQRTRSIGWFPSTYVEIQSGDHGQPIEELLPLLVCDQKLLNDIVQPGRYVIHEGPVMLMASLKDRSSKEAYMFLLNDCLVTSNPGYYLFIYFFLYFLSFSFF